MYIQSPWIQYPVKYFGGPIPFAIPQTSYDPRLVQLRALGKVFDLLSVTAVTPQAMGTSEEKDVLT